MNRLPTIILAVLCLAFLLLLLLAFFRSEHNRNIEKQWRNLDVSSSDEYFDPAVLSELPAPAKRYFQRALQPGEPLASTVRLRMKGQFHGLESNKTFPLVISQLLTPQRGFVWEARIRTGLGFLTASDYFADGSRRSRFHYLGLIPASAGNTTEDYINPDTSIERMALDMIFCPAALLPRPGVEWQAIDTQSARVNLDIQNQTVSMLLHIAADGRLLKITVEQTAPPLATTPGQPASKQRSLQVRVISDRTFDSTTIPAQFLVRWSERWTQNGQHFNREYDILELEVVEAWFK